MSEQHELEPGYTPSTGSVEEALSYALSVHYITMALYVLAIVGVTGMLLLAIVLGEGKNLPLDLILALLPVVLFLLHLMAVKGLKHHQPWGYQASKGLGILLLLGFPFGTVLGLVLLLQLKKFRFDNKGLLPPR